jgi:hypothetical protein
MTRVTKRNELDGVYFHTGRGGGTTVGQGIFFEEISPRIQSSVKDFMRAESADANIAETV